MELWIRSQNKKKLCVAKFFELDNDETGIFCFNGESYSIFAGKYKSKERALEVLDEIEERIMLINTINLAKDTDSLIACKNVLAEEKIKGLNYPYQMPKE